MDYQIPYGFTDLNVNGLIYACYYRDLHLLQEQLAQGVDPNSKDPDGVNAIAHASNEKGFPEGVALLLKAGADPTQVGKRFPYSATIAAASYGHIEILKMFLLHLKNVQVLESLFPNLYPIQTYEFLKPILIERNLKVTGAQLSLAAVTSGKAINQVLDFLPVEANYVDNQGRSSLHVYVTQPDVSSAIVERLLSTGCNPNLQDEFGSTALKLLKTSDHFDSCKMEVKKAGAAIRKAGGKYAAISSVSDFFRSLS